MENVKVTKEQLVEMLRKPEFKGGGWPHTREQRLIGIGIGQDMTFEQALDNIDNYAAACLSIFSLPDHIERKVNILSGYHRKWESRENEKIITGVLERVHLTGELEQGIRNMDMSGMTGYKTIGLDHELENLVYLVFKSSAKDNPVVLSELWKKAKQTPNGSLKPDEYWPFLQLALADDNIYAQVVNLSEVRDGVKAGNTIALSVYPVITDLEKYKEHETRYYKGRSDAPKMIESDAGSKVILEIVDRKIFR